MKRGRKNKPVELKVLEGTNRQDRMNHDAPDVKAEIPVAPSFLGDDAKEEWDQISVELYGLGLLSKIDRAALAAYCQSFDRWAKSERELAEQKLISKTSNGNEIQNPLVGIANKAMENMRKFLVEFGMTPATRSNVKKIKRQQANEWSLFENHG